MNIPIYYFLFFYALFLIMFFIFIFIDISHLVNTGTLTLSSLIVSVIVFSFIALVLYLSFMALRVFDWNSTISIGTTAETNSLLNSGSTLFK
jgi:hypothetical protein